MVKIIVNKPFKFSPDGLNVEAYSIGEHEVTERCAHVAVVDMGVATLATEKRQTKPDANKRRTANKE